MIAFDPRGTGLSGPEMCREQRGARSIISSMDLTLEKERDMKRGAMLACRRSLELNGIDITQYNSVTISRDVVELMTSLGYEKWNLYGGSYGVPFARMIMRLYPEYIRAAVLTSGGDIDMREFLTYDQKNTYLALQKVFRRCLEDPACNTLYPNLEETFYRTYDTFKNQPLKIAVSQEEFDFSYFTFNAHEYVQFIYFQLFGESRLNHLPALIDAFDNQNEEVIRKIIEDEYGSPSSRFNSGMAISVECFDHYYKGDYERQVAYGQGLHPAFKEIPWFNLACEYWLKDQTDESLMTPFKSEIPTLIIHGEDDPTSTREMAEKHKPWFKDLQISTTPGMAHGPPSSRERDCWAQIIAGFINTPHQKIDDSCYAALPEVAISSELPEWLLDN